jgi:dihydropteroate synthase
MRDEQEQQQEIDGLNLQIDLLRRRVQALEAILQRAEGARIEAQGLLADKRGGMLRRPAQKLLDTLDAIEQEFDGLLVVRRRTTDGTP